MHFEALWISSDALILANQIHSLCGIAIRSVLISMLLPKVCFWRVKADRFYEQKKSRDILQKLEILSLFHNLECIENQEALVVVASMLNLREQIILFVDTDMATLYLAKKLGFVTVMLVEENDPDVARTGTDFVVKDLIEVQDIVKTHRIHQNSLPQKSEPEVVDFTQPVVSINSPRKIQTKKDIVVGSIPKLNLDFSSSVSKEQDANMSEAEYNKIIELRMGRPMKLKSIKKPHSPVRQTSDSTEFQVNGNKLSSPKSFFRSLPDIAEEPLQKLQPIILKKRKKKLNQQPSRPNSELDDLLFIDKKSSNGPDLIIKNIDPTTRPLDGLPNIEQNPTRPTREIPSQLSTTSSSSLYHIESNHFHVNNAINNPWRSKVILPSLDDVSPTKSAVRNILSISGQATTPKSIPLSPVQRN